MKKHLIILLLNKEILLNIIFKLKIKHKREIQHITQYLNEILKKNKLEMNYKNKIDNMKLYYKCYNTIIDC